MKEEDLQKELNKINKKLDDLLTKGSNNENLVTRKKEILTILFKTKNDTRNKTGM